MRNAENKKHLIEFLYDQWQSDAYASHIGSLIMYDVCGEYCTKLQAMGNKVLSEPVPELYSSQEEADTRVILHCTYATEHMSRQEVLCVRSPDTDVLVLLLYYVHLFLQTVYFDTGVGNKQRLISVGPIADALGPAVVKALPSFHAFTGADCTSTFIGKGKRRTFKILTQSSSFTDAFYQLEESLENVSSEMLCNLQKYVCCMYGRPKMEDGNKVRSVMFESRYSKDLNSSNIGIDLSLLPLCASSLHLHILRANYQCYVLKNAHKPYSDIPSPTQHGWVTDDA